MDFEKRLDSYLTAQDENNRKNYKLLEPNQFFVTQISNCQRMIFLIKKFG